MTGFAGRLMRDGALWGGALAVVLSMHLAGVLWIMDRPETAAPPGLPEPVLVDLAPIDEQTAPQPQEPAAPQPQPERQPPAPLELPPLPKLEPLDDPTTLLPPVQPQPSLPSDLVLNASARPEARPDQRAAARAEPTADPEPRREPARTAAPEPETRRSESTPSRQPAPAVPQGAGGSGASGVSPQQRADLMAQWGGQIRSCVSRRAVAPRGVRDGGRVTLRLSVSRSGAIQGVGVAGSSGVPALDQAAVQAAQRAGRCPRAPAGLTDAAYPFDLPINLQVR